MLTCSACTPKTFSSKLFSQPIPLEELIRRSEHVLIGRAVSLELGVRPVRVQDQERLRPMLLTSFTGTKIIFFKDHMETSVERVVVSQLQESALNAELGETVLWFMDSSTSSDLIVGQQAGYFRVLGDRNQNERQYVVNLLGNRGLWKEKLWTKELSWEKVGRHVPAAYREEVYRIGSMPHSGGQLPIELLIAVIKAS